jgi:hypothetical protein
MFRDLFSQYLEWKYDMFRPIDDINTDTDGEGSENVEL